MTATQLVSFAADILNWDENGIKKGACSIIVNAISSVFEINTPKLNEYELETVKMLVTNTHTTHLSMLIRF